MDNNAGKVVSKQGQRAASFAILTVKWPITSLFLDANCEYYELSLANKRGQKWSFIKPARSKTKKYESTNTAKVRTALNFLSWCIKEFTF